MGYYASGYGTITIRTDYDTPTLQKLYNSKTLDFRDGSKELQAETFLDLILDHDEAFEAVSYSEEHESTMDLTFCASENYHGKLVEETLAFFAPVTVEGDIEFVGEDDCRWCFHYEDGKFVVYDGRTIYDCDHPHCPRSDCVFSDGERCRSTLVKSRYASEQAVVHDRVVACTGYIPLKATQSWTAMLSPNKSAAPHTIRRGCLKTPCHFERSEESFSESLRKPSKERSFVTSFLRMTKR